jgi:hypothetical protein
MRGGGEVEVDWTFSSPCHSLLSVAVLAASQTFAPTLVSLVIIVEGLQLRTQWAHSELQEIPREPPASRVEVMLS